MKVVLPIFFLLRIGGAYLFSDRVFCIESPFHASLLITHDRGRKRMAAGKQLHGNFTPAHAYGCAAQCFEGVQRGSLIILPVHPRPQAATPVSRPGFVAHLFGRGPVLRTCNRVMAHRPTGSTQTDRIRLPYAARRLSLSRIMDSAAGSSGARKGSKTYPEQL